MIKGRSISIILVLYSVFIISTLSAQAELFNRGTDSLGNRLIYDSDLNITWYDYTISNNTWQNQMNWADALAVTFGGNTYTDWRLPTTVDGTYVFGYDGTTTAGYNIITSNEMGHLFYTELGNKGWFDTSGNPTGCDSSSLPNCLTNKGDFQHLQADYYWTGTELDTNTGYAWYFRTLSGAQGNGSKNISDFYAIAVRPGDVTIVPEPISSILFVTGGMLFAGRSYLRRRRYTV